MSQPARRVPLLSLMTTPINGRRQARVGFDMPPHLTRRQEEILDILIGYWVAHGGEFPTYTVLAYLMGDKTPSAAFAAGSTLLRKGYLAKSEGGVLFWTPWAVQRVRSLVEGGDLHPEDRLVFETFLKHVRT
jgi:hypothetical protein